MHKPDLVISPDLLCFEAAVVAVLMQKGFEITTNSEDDYHGVDIRIYHPETNNTYLIQVFLADHNHTAHCFLPLTNMDLDQNTYDIKTDKIDKLRRLIQRSKNDHAVPCAIMLVDDCAEEGCQLPNQKLDRLISNAFGVPTFDFKHS